LRRSADPDRIRACARQRNSPPTRSQFALSSREVTVIGRGARTRAEVAWSHVAREKFFRAPRAPFRARREADKLQLVLTS
jgi:hypothetical protein